VGEVAFLRITITEHPKRQQQPGQAHEHNLTIFTPIFPPYVGNSVGNKMKKVRPSDLTH
jgi:hypothetical protein